jgi:hypothetical protein
MIKIHWDFVDGTEVPYAEGLKLKDNFSTNCLDFFTTDVSITDIIVISKSDKQISRNKLMQNDGTYTDKEIRPEHNILKILKAGGFKW